MFAAQQWKVDVVEALIHGGAEVDKTNNKVIMHFPDAPNELKFNSFNI